MRSIGWLAAVASIVGGTWAADASSAEAQAKQTVALSSAPAMRPGTTTPVENDSIEHERDRTPMNFASIGMKVGMAGIGTGDYTLRKDGSSYTGRLDKRQGIHLALPIHLGGSGFGWLFEPYFDRSTMNYDITDVNNVVLSTKEAALTAYGMYMGPTFHFQVARPLYLGTGFGLKAAYVKADAFDIAIDAYGRIPVNATYYVSDQLALVAEAGFGYGASVLVDKDIDVDVDTRAATAEKVGNDPKFGTAFAWDFSVGVRLP